MSKKIITVLDSAILSVQVLGAKPEKGKTPLVWSDYVVNTSDPLETAKAFATSLGFQEVEQQDGEGLAWKGMKVVMGKGTSAQTFFAKVKIVYSIQEQDIPTVTPEQA